MEFTFLLVGPKNHMANITKMLREYIGNGTLARDTVLNVFPPPTPTPAPTIAPVIPGTNLFSIY